MNVQVPIILLFTFFIFTTSSYIMFYLTKYLRGRKVIVTHHSMEEVLTLLEKTENNPQYVIQITTRGNEMQIILDGLLKLEALFVKLEDKIRKLIRVEILTELGTDEQVVDDYDFTFPLSFHVVPREYRSNKDTKLKARALHFMIEKRYAEQHKSPSSLENLYIIHFDAESTITLPNLLTIIFSTLKDGMKLIFQGPIAYPNNWFLSNIFSRQMESLRPWNCYDCHHNTKRSVPYHLHGSNTVIRADAEYKVGWDFEPIDGYPVVAEDLFFGILASFKLGKGVFGWHGAVMYEQPALKLFDSLRQRIRWIRGSLQALHVVPSWDEYKSLSPALKRRFQFRIRMKVYLYALGFIPASLSLTGFLYVLIFGVISGIQNNNGSEVLDTLDGYFQNYVMHTIPMWLINFSLFGMFLWFLSIQIGLHNNLQTIPMKKSRRVIEHLKILLITPLATILDTGVVFYTVFLWTIGKHKARWEVTPKSVAS